MAQNPSLNSQSQESGSGERGSDLIAGRYEILHPLGQGGMGTVFKAKHVSLGKIVAIKVLNATLVVDETSRKRFDQEAQAGSSFQHPNLVAIFDHGFSSKNEPFIVMDFIEGESLDSAILKREIKTDEFLNIFVQACRALHYIHKKGIVHRDIKPSNFMLQMIEDEQYIKLVDFGIAKFLADDGRTSQHLTATGGVLGSPIYMSPEQCQGSPIGSRSDIYSLGCVMYECINGFPPFKGDNLLQTMWKHVNDPPPPLQLPDNSAATQRIGAAILKCLQKDPANRFQTVQELLAALSGNSESGSSSRHQMLNAHSGPQPQVPPQQGTPPAGSLSGPHNAVRTPLYNQSGESFKATQSQQMRRLQADMQQREPLPPPVPRDMPSGDSLEWQKPAAIVAGIVIFIACAIPTFQFAQSYYTRTIANKEFDQAEQTFKLGKDHWKEAEAKFEIALNHANPSDEVQRGRIHDRLGRIELSRGEDADANESFTESLAKLKPHMDDNHEYYLDALYGIAETLYHQGAYTKVEEYLSDARRYAGEWSGPEMQADILILSAKNAAQRNFVPQAIVFYDQAVTKYSGVEKKPNDKIAISLVESAEAREKMGYNADAGKRADQAIALVPIISDASVKSDVQVRASAIQNRARAAAASVGAAPASTYPSAAPVSAPVAAVPSSGAPAAPVGPGGPTLNQPNPMTQASLTAAERLIQLEIQNRREQNRQMELSRQALETVNRNQERNNAATRRQLDVLNRRSDY